MSFDDRFDDGESETAAAALAGLYRARRVALVEPIEHAKQVLLRDAWPRVRHANRDRALLLRCV